MLSYAICYQELIYLLYLLIVNQSQEFFAVIELYTVAVPHFEKHSKLSNKCALRTEGGLGADLWEEGDVFS